MKIDKFYQMAERISAECTMNNCNEIWFVHEEDEEAPGKSGTVIYALPGEEPNEWIGKIRQPVVIAVVD